MPHPERQSFVQLPQDVHWHVVSQVLDVSERSTAAFCVHVVADASSENFVASTMSVRPRILGFPPRPGMQFQDCHEFWQQRGLHTPDSSRFPGQEGSLPFPGWPGMKSLVLVFWPPPHDKLQAPQLPQLFQLHGFVVVVVEVEVYVIVVVVLVLVVVIVVVVCVVVVVSVVVFVVVVVVVVLVTVAVVVFVLVVVMVVVVDVVVFVCVTVVVVVVMVVVVLVVVFVCVTVVVVAVMVVVVPVVVFVFVTVVVVAVVVVTV